MFGLLAPPGEEVKRLWSGDGGHWVYSLGWDETLWGGEQPHKSWLDEVCPDRPVLLVRMCSHKVIVNGEAGELPLSPSKNRHSGSKQSGSDYSRFV
jgi:predicted amidohydrolase YtcJ